MGTWPGIATNREGMVDMTSGLPLLDPRAHCRRWPLSTRGRVGGCWVCVFSRAGPGSSAWAERREGIEAVAALGRWRSAGASPNLVQTPGRTSHLSCRAAAIWSADDPPPSFLPAGKFKDFQRRLCSPSRVGTSLHLTCRLLAPSTHFLPRGASEVGGPSVHTAEPEPEGQKA